MEQRMIDIVVNNQLVAVVIEDLAKLFVNTLVNELPLEMSIATYVHYEEQYPEFDSEPINLEGVPAEDLTESTK